MAWDWITNENVGSFDMFCPKPRGPSRRARKKKQSSGCIWSANFANNSRLVKTMPEVNHRLVSERILQTLIQHRLLRTELSSFRRRRAVSWRLTGYAIGTFQNNRYTLTFSIGVRTITWSTWARTGGSCEQYDHLTYLRTGQQPGREEGVYNLIVRELRSINQSATNQSLQLASHRTIVPASPWWSTTNNGVIPRTLFIYHIRCFCLAGTIKRTTLNLTV